MPLWVFFTHLLRSCVSVLYTLASLVCVLICVHTRFARVYVCVVMFARRIISWPLLRRFSSSVPVSFVNRQRDRFLDFSVKTSRLQTELFDEAVSMLVPEEMSPPELNKSFYYFQKTGESGLSVYSRIPADSFGNLMDNSMEEEILDLGKIAKTFGHGEFCTLSAAKISVDNKLVGFVSDVVGDERWTLGFSEIGGTFLKKKFDLVRNFEWIDNTLISGKFFYYTKMDPETLRSTLLVRASLESDDETIVYTCDSGYLDLFKSKDGKYIFVSSNAKNESEIWYVLADDPFSELKLIHPKKPGVEYFCEHSKGCLYMVSNKDYSNFALYKAEMAGFNTFTWSLVHHSVDMFITDLDMFRKGVVLYGHGFEGQPAVEIVGEETVKVPFKGNYAVGKIEVGVNGDYNADKFRFTFRNPRNPGTVLEYDFENRQIGAVKSREFRKNEEIFVQRVLVGNDIPLTIVNGEKCVGRCLVHVYGAYGTVLEPDFSPATISLIRRGWTVVFAHVRGGGERGAEWHLSATKMDKWNSVNDFKTCCNWLVENNVVDSSEKISAVGASAGGLVLAAALNKWGTKVVGGACVLRVPFVDLFDTLSDPSLPLSIHEREEWGNVTIENEAEFIKSISPADNINKNVGYPPLFITCAEDDTRVPFQGIVKYASRLEKDTYILHSRTQGGHFGGENYQDTCAELAFLLTRDNAHK